MVLAEFRESHGLPNKQTSVIGEINHECSFKPKVMKQKRSYFDRTMWAISSMEQNLMIANV